MTHILSFSLGGRWDPERFGDLPEVIRLFGSSSGSTAKYTYHCSPSHCKDVVKSQGLSKPLFPYRYIGVVLPVVPSL